MKRVLYLFVFLLASCANTQSPVTTRSVVDAAIESERLGGKLITIVQSRETWYSIAFENSISVSNLAAWNGMSSSDILRVGQRLRLTKPINFKAVKPGTVEVSSVPSSSSTASVNNTKTVKPAYVGSKWLSWSWPVKGKVVNSFSIANARKGIDISAPHKQDITAAASGKVVYQGNGIKGYKNLIILKHNSQFLSAYAYNERVYVQEGQIVKKGERISTVGLKNGKPLLHFEIRKEGKPVNPLSYLN